MMPRHPDIFITQRDKVTLVKRPDIGIKDKRGDIASSPILQFVETVVGREKIKRRFISTEI